MKKTMSAREQIEDLMFDVESEKLREACRAFLQWRNDSGL